MHIVTYTSTNADPGKEWVAWLVLDSGRLPVAFFADTEAKATREAQAEWDKHEKVRERNIAAREEGRRKAAETKARKAKKP
jgi:hypothetical protein